LTSFSFATSHFIAIASEPIFLISLTTENVSFKIINYILALFFANNKAVDLLIPLLTLVIIAILFLASYEYLQRKNLAFNYTYIIL